MEFLSTSFFKKTALGLVFLGALEPMVASNGAERPRPRSHSMPTLKVYPCPIEKDDIGDDYVVINSTEIGDSTASCSSSSNSSSSSASSSNYPLVSNTLTYLSQISPIKMITYATDQLQRNLKIEEIIKNSGYKTGYESQESNSSFTTIARRPQRQITTRNEAAEGRAAEARTISILCRMSPEAFAAIQGKTDPA